jgi:hypothetical protein
VPAGGQAQASRAFFTIDPQNCGGVFGWAAEGVVFALGAPVFSPLPASSFGGNLFWSRARFNLRKRSGFGPEKHSPFFERVTGRLPMGV